MNVTRAVAAAVAALATVLFAEKEVAAQEAPATRGAPPSDAARGLDFTLDFFGGWEGDLSNVLVDPSTGIVGDTSGGLGGLNARLSTEHEGEHLRFNFGGDASVRYYPALVDEVVPGYGVTLELQSREARRVSWRVSQLFSYAPFNTLSYLSEGIVVGAPSVDYQISTAQSLQSDTAGRLGFRVSRRGEISLRGGYNIVEASENDEFGGVRRWHAGAVYTHNVGRYIDAYGGYSYNVSEFRQEPGSDASALNQPVIGTIEAGVNYARALSFSRRTTLSFRTGTSTVDYGGSTEFQFIGAARLNHQIGRTWNVAGGYERSVRFVQTFVQPALMDTVTVDASGRTSQRTAIQAAASYINGAVGPRQVGNDLDNGWASVQFRWALAQRVAFFSQYFYFRSELGPLVFVPESLGRDQQRHGIRVGLSLGTTLLGERR
jgi:hypothetical protein